MQRIPFHFHTSPPSGLVLVPSPLTGSGDCVLGDLWYNAPSGFIAMAKKQYPPSAVTPEEAVREVEQFLALATPEAEELLRSLRSFCFRKLGDLGKESVEDILGDVLMKIWEKRETYRGNGLKYWVFMIARNAMFDHLRRLQTRRKVWAETPTDEDGQSRTMDELGTTGDGGAISAASTVAEASSVTDAIDMKATLEALPSSLLQIVELCVLEGYTRKEVSEALDLPMGTVTSRLTKALKLLREALEGGQ